MEYKTIFKLITGTELDFEAKINDLYGQGYIWFGDMSTSAIDGKLVFSMLLSKTVKVEEPTN